jgi:hypothetical protein
LGERSGAPSGLRPSSFVMWNTPVEVQFTSAECLNYPCRTPPFGTSALGHPVKVSDDRVVSTLHPVAANLRTSYQFGGVPIAPASAWRRRKS